MSKEKREFRLDINGLRAWAVSSVILFHFGIAGFSGGYVGVDIFFVISGFLMTGIIYRSLEQGALRQPGLFLWRFYLARGKRILPALIVLCAVLLILQWFRLSADEFSALGEQAASAVLFFSNVKFWRETGYFAPSAHQLWLLHTWSLSVEWQFYIILPVAMMGVWLLAPGRRAMLWLLTAGGLLSLALCLYLARHKASTAFFLLPPRAWEMIVGGIVALLPQWRPDTAARIRAVEWGGFALIAVSIFGFGHLTWPDWYALVPVAGTALVLLAARNDSVLTALAPMQWAGRCSYSLYLWHWPIVVFLYYTEQQHNTAAIVAAVLATMVLGQLSYALVETRLRLPLESLSFRAASALLLAAVCMVAIPGRLISQQGGIASRLPANVNAMFAAAHDNEAMKDCQIQQRGNDTGCLRGGLQPGVIVLGDSHGAALFGAVAKASPDPSLGALKWTLLGCPSIPGVHDASDPENHCEKFMDWTMRRLPEIPAGVPVLIINRTALYLEGPNESTQEDITVPSFYFKQRHAHRDSAFHAEMQQQLVAGVCAIAKNRPVYMLRPIPEMKINVPVTMGRAMLAGKQRDISISLEEYRKRTATAWAAQDAAHDQCGARILDPIPYLCHDGKCNALENGRSLYYDDNHLSTFGGSHLIPLFSKIYTTH